MKFYFISKYGDSLPIAYHMKQEGHQVKFFISEKKNRDLYHGIFDIDTTPKPSKADYVIFDMVGGGTSADQMRRQGYKVFGSSKLADDLELKRGIGADFAKRAGVKVPPTIHFDKVDDGIAHIKKNMSKTWVFKPEKNLDLMSTTVSDDNEEQIVQLEMFKKRAGDLPFILQEKIKGVEVSTEGWFNDNLWVSGVSITFEEKRLMTGNLGPNTGSANNIVTVIPGMKQPLFRKLLWPLTSLLRANHYVGPIDVNSIVAEDDRQPYFLEFTARMGYDAIYPHLKQMNCEVGKYFADFIDGRMKKFPLGQNLFSGSERVSIPPYPDEEPAEKDLKMAKGVLIKGWKEVGPDFWPVDITMEGPGRMVCAGSINGYIGVITGVGNSIKATAQNIYDKVKYIKAVNLQYRTDLGEGAEKNYSRLKEWGIINSKD